MCMGLFIAFPCYSLMSIVWMKLLILSSGYFQGNKRLCRLDNSGRSRTAALRTLAGVAHLATSGRGGWEYPLCHPDASWENRRLQPLAEFPQKQEHQAEVLVGIAHLATSVWGMQGHIFCHLGVSQGSRKLCSVVEFTQK